MSIEDPRFDSRFDATRRETVGRYPIPPGVGLREVECVHCSRPLGVSRWDHLNGFLVMCPHCGGYHGRSWHLKRTLLAGLFFNALSFFFVMRPLNALGTALAFAAACWGLMALAARYEYVDAYMIAAVGTLGLGPVLINAIVLVRHQLRLDRAPPGR